MNILSRWSRAARSRGYGVQSPYAYRFLRDVISETLPYSAYADLWPLSRREGPARTALCQLYFRLVNRLQASLFVDVAPPSSLTASYVAAACSRTRYVKIASAADIGAITAALHGSNGAAIVLLRLGHDTADTLQEVAKNIGSNTFLILEGIHSSSDARRQWRFITACPAAGICFDALRCGLVLPHDRLTRHIYKVNLPRPWHP